MQLTPSPRATRRTWSFRLAAHVAVLFASSCSLPPPYVAWFVADVPPIDTGLQAVDSADGRDAPRDDRTTGNGMMFKPCTAAAACGTGFTCDLTFPGGQCTKRCTSDTVCGAAGVCATNLSTGNKQCYQSCTTGDMSCEPLGAACADLIVDASLATVTTVSGCQTSCFATDTTPPAGFNNTCPMGRTCDPNVFQCLTTPTNNGPGAIGDPCTAGPDCKSGFCFPESDTTGPTGFVGGYCFTYDAFFAGDPTVNNPIPQGNCPAGSAAIPLDNNAAEGDGAECEATCTRTSANDIKGTCRVGYHCIYGTMGTMSTTDGTCDPIDCNSAAAAALANSGCPANYACVVSGNPVRGTCAARRDAGVTDAANDSDASDAGAVLDGD